jgi:hypothetical protein
MWAGVTERFRRFHADVQPSTAEANDAIAKQLGVRQSLQRTYWGATSDNPPGFIVGSWGKRTMIRPSNDIDVFMQLPLEVYTRVEGLAGNKQSALLQEVKNSLVTTYWQTDMRGDGQVVVVNFNTIKVEVVPVFRWGNDGAWLMPDTNNGGRWRIVYPDAEGFALDRADVIGSRNCRPLIQVAKSWKYHCNVPIKSFHLEQLVADFVSNYAHRDQGYFYYDWFIRDFLFFLCGKRNASIYAPASNEMVGIGDAWYSRAATAYDRAVKACEYEREDYIVLAGEEWQKLFGTRIASYLG